MLKWTAAGQRGGTVQSWRQATVVQVQADESPSCFTEKPRRRRVSRRMSGRHDKENSTCADAQTPTSKTCRTRRRESLRDVSNHNSPATTTMQLMSPGGRRTKSPCTETHWMPVQKRRSGDDIFWTDDKVKRKKPCTADHVIDTPVAVAVAPEPTTADTVTVPANDNGQLCVSMSPTEEPVQLSHKQLPSAATAFRTTRLPDADDLRASMLIDRYVDQIYMNDCTLVGGGFNGPGDRLSIVSPLAKRLADIRLRRSPGPTVATNEAGRKRKRTISSDQQDDDCPQRTPALPNGKRPTAWWQCPGGGIGGGAGSLTLPDDLASPFHSSYRNYRHHQYHPLHTTVTVPPSPITPLRRGSGDILDDDSDDYWKTPVGRPVAGFRGDSLLSTTSSKTVDDEIICCSDPRSPAVLDETFTMKSRRCLSFVSPPPSDKKKQRRSLKKSASVDKGSGLELSIGLKDLTHLTVLLKRGRNLVCADGDPPNTYIKVYLVPGKGTCHRTRIRYNSANPRFDESFTVPVSEEDQDKRILISVWHRDRSKRRSEFLGYMSFAVKNVVKKEINGTFKLVPQSSPGGRMPPHSTPAHRPQDLTVIKAAHCNSIDEDDDDDDVAVEEEDNNIMIDDEPCSTTTAAVASAGKVKISDQKPKKDNNNANVKTGNEENKFLQYLELDPPMSSRDGKTGRTPFTVTKRLSKPSGSSFGFSIAWTHPPRVERVECGLPADQADLKPGDYVVFINKTNVVMMAEDDVMELIKSCGNQLSLEVYNKTSTANRRNNQPPPRSSSTPGVLNLAATAVSQSDTTVSLQEPPRRRFHIPQVTFTSENISGDMDSQLRWVHQLLTIEQQFLLCMQFGIGRYLLPLAERKDVLKSKEHAALFQNAQELLRITVDTVERIIETDWKMLARDTCNVYVNKIDQFNGEYYKYCKGIIHADCVLVDKVRNPHFLDLIKDPPIPDRRPDLFTFIHKPLEHYRNVLKCMQLIQINTEPDDEIFEALSHIVHEMQTTYRFITVESGQTEPEVENKPLLSLSDLEARLVFTRCKPFTLNTPDRRWIFAGDLSRVEGRSVRTYWALLFSDILLFTKVSRDRVLFVTDEPLPLTSITQTQFSVKKKDTEFRLVISNGTDTTSSCHSSPAMTGCSPLFADLSGTLSRLPKNKGRVIVLRAPKAELKAVWQNLIQRQILALDKNASALDGKCKNGSSSEPEQLDSPDDLLMNSLATLDDDDVYADRLKSFAESLVDERCRRMSKSSACNKGKALHISQWIKGELGGTGGGSSWTDWGGGRRSSDGPEDNDEDAEFEIWSQERMDAKKMEIQRRLAASKRDECGSDVIIESTTETVSVLSSPDDSQRTVVPENVCDKCQKTCDINGNQQSDAFLDMNPDNKWKPSTVTVSAVDLSPCEPFGCKDNHHTNDNDNNNNNNDDDDEDEDDNDEPERPYAMLASSPPQQRHHHHYQQQQQQQQTRHRRVSSTSSLDRTGMNRDHSTDSLDRVEFCSTTDYRWPEDFCPVTASCYLPTDEDYNYDASSEEFWGTPNSSTTSPLSVDVNYSEERQNETLFGSVQLQVTTSSTPKKRPLRLEPLIEEIESSENNTPSYDYKEIVYGEGHTLLNFENGPGSSKDQKHAVDKSTTKNLFNMLWRTSTRSRSKRTCGGESKFGANFIRRRRIKSEKSKQNKEIKLNLIESVYLLLFG